MNQKNILIFEQLLCDLSSITSKNKELINELNKTSISQLTKNLQARNQKYNSTLSKLSRDFLDAKLRTIENEEKSSCNLNVFKMFGLDEKKHSHIIANLLNPNAKHGQRHLFLNNFLDLLGIERFSDNENWTVTAEKGRVDILLKRNHPHSVIIIENKSNYAKDQENQLYRYWHQEIYKTIQEKNLPPSYILNPPNKFYQLVYLSPANWKIPTNNSIEKPSGWDKNLPNKTPLEIKHLLFSGHIVDWLTVSLEKIPEENTRLREYIIQYLELWN